jgi:hypothetical protein
MTPLHIQAKTMAVQFFHGCEHLWRVDFSQTYSISRILPTEESIFSWPCKFTQQTVNRSPYLRRPLIALSPFRGNLRSTEVADMDELDIFHRLVKKAVYD